MKDLTGQRFGRLVAIEPTDRRVDQMVVWRCVCDCGSVAYAMSSNLTRGRVRSCGCLAREARSADLSGRRFGSLVAVDAGPGAGEWRCVCDCGRVVRRSAADLKSGGATSCGQCDQRAQHGQHAQRGHVAAASRAASSHSPASRRERESA